MDTHTKLMPPNLSTIKAQVNYIHKIIMQLHEIILNFNRNNYIEIDLIEIIFEARSLPFVQLQKRTQGFETYG